MNTVGPYDNRQETYAYFSLPFCNGRKQSIGHYHETLSEALQGVELEFSGYAIDFKGNNFNTKKFCLVSKVINVPLLFSFFLDDISPIEICMIDLDEQKVTAFTYAVRNNYWYQMYIDGLPIWGRVGERGDDKKYYIYAHKKFEIGYNGKRIVDVKLTTERKEELVAGAKIKVTYEVSFHPSTVEFADRFNKYLDPTFFQHRVSD